MTSDIRYIIEKLNRNHDRTKFDCGEDSLNDYLHKYARQNSEKGLGATYVAVREGESQVLAYYTISSGQVAREVMPEQERKALPRYPVPVVRVGRLAADISTRGEGLGRLMLIDSLYKALSIAEILGIYAVEVDALKDGARVFYEKHGFRSLVDDKLHLYLPIKMIRTLLS